MEAENKTIKIHGGEPFSGRYFNVSRPAHISARGSKTPNTSKTSNLIRITVLLSGNIKNNTGDVKDDIVEIAACLLHFFLQGSVRYPT